jgi:hypothetical protein
MAMFPLNDGKDGDDFAADKQLTRLLPETA